MPPTNIVDSTYLYVTRLATLIFYNVRDHFDPIPPWPKGEETMEYLTRIDKKYAIRFIDRQLWGIPDYDISLMDSYLQSPEFPEERRENFEAIREAVLVRQKYATIKQLLLER